MIYLKGKPVIEWLGFDGCWYLVRTAAGRFAVKLHQLGADEGADEVTRAARCTPRI